MKGFTRLHPQVPEALRGTYLGLALGAGHRGTSKPLGVTTVELMPVHEHLDEPCGRRAGADQLLGLQHARVLRARPALRDARGRRRCASSRRWSSGCTRPGIEVVLDVVYNHSCEGDEHGPTVSLARHRQPRLLPPRAGRSRASTSTTPAAATRSTPTHPQVLKLVTDSLRYWVTEMHVDGFRFDLAAGAGARRGRAMSTASSAFFAVVHQDPVLSRIKLIAEPWDVGARRLPGRQLPDPLVGVERPLPRHGAVLLARRPERDRATSATA